jgi:Zn-dependent protease with chaperone function
MQNSNLGIQDFRYAREVPVFWTTAVISSILILAMFILAWPVALGFVFGLVVLTITLYLRRISILGSSVRVSEKQFPKIYEMTRIASQKLNVEMPPVYIMQSPVINAFASGFVGNHVIILHSALIQAMNDDELMYIIGHELTHIKGHHVLINVLIGDGAQRGAGILKGLSWLQGILRFIFLYLGRCFEFTCDRGGLIAVGDVKPCITAQAKLAVGPDLFKNINMMEFYQQALELDQSKLGFFAELQSTHPYTLNRIRDSVRFYRSPEYRRIAAMFGKQGTSTLQGSLATGDLMQRILNKEDKWQAHPGNDVKEPQVIQGQHLAFAVQKCQSCGSHRKGDSKFCTTCGSKFQATDASPKAQQQPAQENLDEVVSNVAPTANQFCTTCGVPMTKPGAKFCSGCGNPF